ncbi:MAG: DeoR/GlpR transcriptional regulator [Erysipelotrichaceae bacterium]|nr:DeoR/GlpR transcriptional regulator [Erysipelotrichaceae bacterium]
MRKQERLVAILEELRENGSIKSSELSRKFNISEMTVWRDIAELEKAGVVRRYFGGAVDIKAGSHVESSINERVFENTRAKELIAERAVGLLKENDRVFIDSGSTCYAIAKKMTEIPFRLFCSTNTLNTAAALCKNNEIRTIMIGGEMKGKAMCSIGPSAESQLKGYNFSVSFIACNAIDENGNVMILDIAERGLKKSVIDISDHCYLVCDSTKIFKTSMIEFSHISEFSGIIIDKDLDPKQKRILEQKGAIVLLAE